VSSTSEPWGRGGRAARLTWATPNNGLELTASSVRSCAPSYSSSSGLALGGAR
jgi:hypothetical protein